MDLKLKRSSYESVGIFGWLLSVDEKTPLGVTLERAYQCWDGSWMPKLSKGIYTCRRGIHHLHSGPVETFEVMGVPYFQSNPVNGLLCCHIGNKNEDSEGCVLLGTTRNLNVITESKNAFNNFMALQAGIDQYQLVVE